MSVHEETVATRHTTPADRPREALFLHLLRVVEATVERHATSDVPATWLPTWIAHDVYRSSYLGLVEALEDTVVRIRRLPCCSDITEGYCYCPNGQAKRRAMEAIAKARGVS